MRSHGERGHSHFRAIGEYQSDPVMAPQSHGMQHLPHIVDMGT
jgi:hypothetical protein